MKTGILDQTESAHSFSTNDLTNRFKSYRLLLDQVPHAQGLMDLILNDFEDLTTHFISVGDREFNAFKIEGTQKPVNLREAYLLHFRLAESFKNVLLLHRDVFLQLNIAQNKRAEDQLSHEILNSHFLESRKTLIHAVDWFIQYSANEKKSIIDEEKNFRKFYEEIKHQKNPWEIYREQFLTILKQCKEIEAFSEIVLKSVKIFKEIKEHIYHLNEQVHSKFLISNELILEAISKLESIKEIKDITPVIVWVEKILDDREPNIDQQQNFAIPIENKTRSLQDLEIPMATHEGLLFKKHIELNKVTNKWLEYVLMPLLVEIWETENSMESFLDHSLLNLKSGLLLAKNNNAISSVDSQIPPLREIINTIEENISKHQEVKAKIEELLNESFVVTKSYHQEDFLEVSLQSSLAQYSSVRDNLFKRLKSKLQIWFKNLGSKYEEANLSSAHKRLEAATACINYRMFKESNTSYDSLFRNKIFIGDLFLVPREEEEKMLIQSLQNWKAGFNQSAVIVGNHLSGKTTFMEYVAKKHFGKQIIKLEVTGTISVEGRKFQANYDLNEALKFVKNNVYRSNPLIIIDNIELWRNDQHSLLNNARAVIKYIESESDNAYVMVATSKAMQEHLDTRVLFTNSFSTIINVNRSSQEEIRQAVMLRHGASHKDLITTDKQILSQNQIERRVDELSRQLNYNLGKVLQAWTYSSTVVDDKLVLFEEKDYPFRDFFNPQELIVLKYVALYQHINEVELKNYLGRSNSVYLSGLKRLVNTKVLIRSEDGNLHLNTVIYHDIVDILKYRGLL